MLLRTYSACSRLNGRESKNKLDANEQNTYSEQNVNSKLEEAEVLVVLRVGGIYQKVSEVQSLHRGFNLFTVLATSH
jgi:hypothetical protein